MKILLDENIPHDLRPHLRHHVTFTVAYLGWASLKNGLLLNAAEKDGFEVLITGDLSLKYQQNFMFTADRCCIAVSDQLADYRTTREQDCSCC